MALNYIKLNLKTPGWAPIQFKIFMSRTGFLTFLLNKYMYRNSIVINSYALYEFQFENFTLGAISIQNVHKSSRHLIFVVILIHFILINIYTLYEFISKNLTLGAFKNICYINMCTV